MRNRLLLMNSSLERFWFSIDEDTWKTQCRRRSSSRTFRLTVSDCSFPDPEDHQSRVAWAQQFLKDDTARDWNSHLEKNPGVMWE